MNYLIDGHNLIGKIEDIQLSDPDDEAKLVLRLINWAATGKNRRVIVVFDGGTHGAQWSNLRSERVKAVFVPQGKTADEWLIRFMRDQIKNVREFHLVTSDRAILKQAENRRIDTSTSEKFANELAEERRQLSDLGRPKPAPTDRPLLQEHEVDAWLQLFGGEPELEVRPYQARKQVEEPVPPLAGKSAELTTPEHEEDYLLSPEEVGAWLDLFGGEPNVLTVYDPSTRAKVKPGAHTGKSQRVRPLRKGPEVKPDSKLSQDDVDLWHTLFGDD